MSISIPHGPRTGEMKVPSSKSQAHRLLICAALSEGETRLHCGTFSKDIEATVACLNALGAEISEEEPGVLRVRPIHAGDETGTDAALLLCGESGSTLRFLIPLCGALGIPSVFRMEGRLPERPIDELERTCTENGMHFEHCGAELRVSGALKAGIYSVDGRISSQYITGLLFALPLLDGSSELHITGGLESSAYVRMTEEALHMAGITFDKDENDYRIGGGQRYRMPEELPVECDWSGAAFPLCMGAFSSKGVTVCGLHTGSVQGDKKILDVLRSFGADVRAEGTAVTVKKPSEDMPQENRMNGILRGTCVDGSEIPDLILVICAVAAGASGETRIIHAERLRLKESDRIKTTAEMIRSLGGEAVETEDGLIIRGQEKLTGGTVDPYGDHRIAMSAAVAAGICTGEVRILNPECTDKSFPGFFESLSLLEAEQ